ncbi:MAG: hypothetical protein ACWA45_05510 [Flavobacteriales bacterium]
MYKTFVDKQIKFGEWKSFYENGQLKEIGTYSWSGDKEAIWKSYYENGQLKAVGEYFLGSKRGKWKLYDQKGKRIKN